MTVPLSFIQLELHTGLREAAFRETDPAACLAHALSHDGFAKGIGLPFDYRGSPSILVPLSATVHIHIASQRRL